MARSGVGFTEVANLADKLAEQGINPTNVRIQTELGGSFSTINRHLQQWRSGRPEHTRVLPVLPPELVKAVGDLWEIVKHDSNQEIQQLTAAHIVDIDAQAQLLTEANVDKQRLTAQVKALGDDNHTQANTITTLEAKIKEQAMTYELLTTKHQSAEAQIAAQEAEQQRLHQLCQTLQTNLTHYQQEQQQLRQQEALRYEQERQTTAYELKQLQSMLNDTIQQKQSMALKAEQLLSNQQTLSEQQQALQTTHNELQIQYQTQTLSLQHLQAFKDAHEQTLPQLQQQYHDSQQQLAIATDHNQRLTKELQQAHGTVNLLRQEKLELAQSKALIEGQLTAFWQQQKLNGQQQLNDDDQR